MANALAASSIGGTASWNRPGYSQVKGQGSLLLGRRKGVEWNAGPVAELGSQHSWEFYGVARPSHSKTSGCGPLEVVSCLGLPSPTVCYGNIGVSSLSLRPTSGGPGLGGGASDKARARRISGELFGSPTQRCQVRSRVLWLMDSIARDYLMCLEHPVPSPSSATPVHLVPTTAQDLGAGMGEMPPSLRAGSASMLGSVPPCPGHVIIATPPSPLPLGSTLVTGSVIQPVDSSFLS